MITQELTDQVRTEIKRLKEVQDQFLQTYKRYCDHFGGPGWRKEPSDGVGRRLDPRNPDDQVR